MSEHKAELKWNRDNTGFGYREYSRNHTWTFHNGLVVEASAATQFLGDASRIDPEEAFVASLSSCHMLTFLAICSRKHIVVDEYTDSAVGHLEKGPNGKPVLARVELHPKVNFSGTEPGADELRQLHDRAHHECFLANSVLTEIKTVL